MPRGRLAINMNFWGQIIQMKPTGLLSRNVVTGYPGGGWALEEGCITTEYVRLIGQPLCCIRGKQRGIFI